MTGCWLARHSPKPCDGPMDRAHLIAKQTLKREVSRDPEFVWHPAVWRWACRLHHGDFDNGALRIRRTDLPESVEVFARKFDLLPKLDRRYGGQRCEMCEGSGRFYSPEVDTPDDPDCAACDGKGYV